MSKKVKKPLTKKKKVWILVAALSVFLAAAVTAAAILVPIIMGSPADPKVRWYNEEDTEFVITTADELYDLAYLSTKYNFEGQTIKLGADIVINEGDATTWGTKPPSRLWYPIANFNGTFDGQGHTISGLYGISFNEEMGLFSFTGARAVVRNLRITNSYLKSSGEHGTGFVASNGGGTFENIYVSGTIHSDNWNNGGIIGCIDFSGDTTITNCWFDGDMILVSDQGRVAGGIVGDIMPEGGGVSISHCLATGSFSAEAITHTGRGRLMDIGGIVGRATSGTTNITDCFANVEIDSQCVVGAGTLIGAAGKGKTFISHSYAPAKENVKSVGHRYNQVTGDVYTYDEEYVLGYEAYSWTTLDFENYWAVDEDGTPILKTFADKVPDLSGVKRMIDTSWYTKRNTATINTLEQLRGLHVVTQWDNMSGKTIYLGADIVFQEGDASTWRENAPETQWKGLGSANTMFVGTFDGLGHSISGLYQKAPTSGLGLFVAVYEGACIRNVKLVNSYFETTSVADNNQTYAYIGSISAYARGATFDNCYSNAYMVSDGYFCGGLVGLMRNGKASIVTNCWYDGTITLHGENTGMRGGGIVGCVWNTTLNMTHSLFTGKMTSESWAWGANEGLMVGYPNANSTITIEDSLCAGSLTVLEGKKDGNGMIVGRIAADSNVTFNNVYAIKTPDPKDGKVIIDGEEKTWYSNWGLTAYRGAPITCTGPAIIFEEKYLTGIAAYQYTDLNFEKYWAIDPEGHPVLQAFMDDDYEMIDVTQYAKIADHSWYGAEEEYYIGSRAQMVSLSFIATGDNFKDKTIYLTNNVSLNSGNAENWGTYAPANEWIPIGSADLMFAGTFNGLGHTISGMYINEPDNGLGLFGMVREGTVGNFRLTNSFVRSYMASASLQEGKYTNYSYIGAVAAYGAKATFYSIYTDAIVWNQGEMTGGIVGLANRANEPVSISNCWFDGTIVQDNTIKKKDGSLGSGFAAGILGLVRNNSATISHCLVTGTFKGINIEDGTWGTVVGGIVARADQTGTNAAGTLTITDSLANIKVEGYPSSIQGNGTIASQINPNVPFVAKNVYAVQHSWKHVANLRSPELSSGAAVFMPKSYLTGVSGYQYTELDFKNYWAVDPDGTPILKSFMPKDMEKVDVSGYEKLVDYSWYNNNSELYISNAKQLTAFAILSSGEKFTGKTVYLTDDIVLNEGDASTWADGSDARQWITIGNATTMFGGTFDGQGHTISGLYIDKANNGLGLFGMVSGATIKNFRLTNSFVRSNMVAATMDSGSVSSYAYIGAITGYAANTTFDSIYTDAIVWNDGEHTGGFVGLANTLNTPVTINNCWFDGKIVQENTGCKKSDGSLYSAFAGGFIGTLRNNSATISNSLMSGTIEGINMPADIYGTVAGGMVGRIDQTGDNPAGTLTISNSLSNLKVKGFTAASTGNGSVISQSNPGVALVLENVYAVNSIWKPISAHRSPELATGAIATVSAANITGSNAYIYAPALGYDTYWTALEGKTPELTTFATGTAATEVKVNTDWYDGTKTEYVLTTADQILGFAQLSKTETFEGITIKLGNDIVWNEGDASEWGTTAPAKNWISIGSQASRFKGTFDGQGHTISGIYYQNDGADGTAMFECIDGGTVTNFKIVNSYFDDTRATTGSAAWSRVASVVATAYSGTVSNIYSDAYVSGGTQYNGGIVGLFRAHGTTVASELTIENCQFAGTLDLGETGRSSGGILGGVVDGNNGYTTLNVKDCLMSGDIVGTYSDAGLGNDTHMVVGVGGVFGSIINVKTNVQGVLVTGTIDVADDAVYVGSLLGYKNYGGITGNSGAIYILEDVYSQMFYSVAHNTSGATWGASMVKSADITGGMARNTAYGLDFTENGAWIAVDGKYPELRSFSTASEAPTVANPIDTSWYDDSKTEFVLTTVNELRGFSQLSQTHNFKGKTIKLGADIVVNTGDAADWATGAPEIVWVPASTSLAFEGTFDGQGYTISGLYTKNTENGYAAFIGQTRDATIKNLRIENTYFEVVISGEYNATTHFHAIPAIVGRMMGAPTVSNIYTDAILVGGKYAGIIGHQDSGTGMTISGCWFDGVIDVNLATDGRGAGGIIAQPMNNQTTTITNCLFTGTITGGASGSYIGGIVGIAPYNATVKMSNCLSAGDMTGLTAGTVGSVAGNNAGANRCTYSNVYATAETYSAMAGANGNLSGFSTVKKVNEADILGGLARWNMDIDFSASSAWIAVENSVPELRYFSDATDAPEVPDPAPVTDPTVETTKWYNETDTEFVLTTIGELKGFATLSQTNTFAGKTIKLGADIVWNEGNATSWATTAPANVWAPIGNKTTLFQGTFDGQGHTISGLYVKPSVTSEALPIGFFATTSNKAVIKNVNIVNSYFNNTTTLDGFWSCTGAVVGFAMNGLTLENVYSDAILEGGNNMGMVGYLRNNNANPAYFKKCWFYGQINTLTSGDIRAGGLWGKQDNQAGLVVEVSDCLLTHTTTGGVVGSDTAGQIGGLAGGSMNNPALKITNTLIDCRFDLTYIPSYWHGAITGFSGDAKSDMTTTNLYVTEEAMAGISGALVSGGHAARASNTWTGTTVIARAEILGDLATAKMSGFDFTNTWTTVQASVPVLKTMAEFAPEDPNKETTKWYNDTETEFVLTTVGELKGFVTLSQTNTFAGKTIKLGADIVWNEGNAEDWATNAPANVWNAIAQTNANGFLGTFDGQGHTISGLYYNGNGYAALVGRMYGTGVVKNVAVVNSYLKSTTGSETFHHSSGIVGRMTNGATVNGVYTDAILVADKAAGIVAFNDNGDTNIINCWFDGTIDATNTPNAAGMLGSAKNVQTHTISNCLFTGTIIGGKDGGYYGGLVGIGPYDAKILASNCLVAGDMTGVTAGTVGAVIGNNPGHNYSTYANVYATNETHSNLAGAGGNLSNFTVVAVNKADILGDLATTAISGFNFTDTWTTVNGYVPVLKAFVAFAPEDSGSDEPVEPPVVDPNEETTAWYNETDTEFLLTTVGELKGFVTLSQTNNFAGKTIKLGADIVWNEGNAADWATNAPANKWIPISNDNQFRGTFDGQGYTISGLYTKQDNNTYAAFVGQLYGGTVKNINITNSYFESVITGTFDGANTHFHCGVGIVGRIAQAAKVEGIYTDAIFVGGRVAGIVAFQDHNSDGPTIKNCWFDGTINVQYSVADKGGFGGIMGFVRNSKTTTIENCLFTGTINVADGVSGNYIGGIVGMGPYNAKVIMSNSLSAGTVAESDSNTIGSVIGNNPGGNGSTYTNVYATNETNSKLAGAGGDKSKFTVVALNRDDILGDLATAKLTGFDFTETWTTVNFSTPVLKALVAFAPEVVDPTAETTEWYNDTDTEFVLTTVGELKGLATLSETNNFAGKTIKLGADIVWNTGDAADWATTAPANVWIPISDSTPFSGTFDGQGYTISGLYTKNVVNRYATFIGQLYNGTVKNVNITNSYFESVITGTFDTTTHFHCAAGIIGRVGQGARIEGIYTDAILVGGRYAGIVGFQDHNSDGPTIKNCWFDGTITAKYAVADKGGFGGVMGFVRNSKTTTIENCLFTGTITVADGLTGAYMGGLVGMGPYSAKVIMSNCLSAGVMTGTENNVSGAIIGNNPGGNGSTYTNVYATSETNSNLAGAGGDKSKFTVTAFATNDILGDLATAKLTGFDFANVWTVVDGETPVLRNVGPNDQQ